MLTEEQIEMLPDVQWNTVSPTRWNASDEFELQRNITIKATDGYVVIMTPHEAADCSP